MAKIRPATAISQIEIAFVEDRSEFMRFTDAVVLTRDILAEFGAGTNAATQAGRRHVSTVRGNAAIVHAMDVRDL